LGGGAEEGSDEYSQNRLSDYEPGVFRISSETFTDEPAILFTLWGRSAGQWKVIAYHVESPESVTVLNRLFDWS
jgi:hypothetical protein